MSRAWQWADADGKPLMYFARTHSLINFVGEVRLAAGDEADAEPAPGTQAVLVLFGWYLMLLRKQRMMA